MQQDSNVNTTSEDSGNNVLNLKLKALMLDTIHHINVIEELINFNVTNLQDWHWQKQLRYIYTKAYICTTNQAIG